MNISRYTPSAATLLLILSACGGNGGTGGDRTLTVDFRYSAEHAYLFHDNTLSLVSIGLEGNSPNCALASGLLPPGMTIERVGCNIRGVPTELGTYNMFIKLTVPNFSGSVEKQVMITSLGPSLSYPFSVSTRAGVPIQYAPLRPAILPAGAPDWTPSSTEQVRYSLTEGTLPPGITLNATTGALAGFATKAGPYAIRISATVTSSSRTASAEVNIPILLITNGLDVRYVAATGAIVNLPTSDFVQSVQLGTAEIRSAMVPQVIAPPEFASSDYIFTNFRLAGGAFLPPGMQLNAATGEIFGRADTPGRYVSTIEADIKLGNLTSPITFPVLQFQVSS